MADTESFSLQLWSRATFRVASFTAVVAMSIHLRGSLPAALSQLDTAIGFGFFLYLWTTTWFATRRGFRYRRRAEAHAESSIAATVVAGGWNGLYLFAVLFAGLLFPIVTQQREAPLLLIVLFGSTCGSLLAFVVGGAVGLLYGLIEALLLGLSAALLRWTQMPWGGPLPPV